MQKSKAMQWVKALRSGKYKQGSEYLRNVNEKGVGEHCCLGVLAEISKCDSDKINNRRTLSNGMNIKCGIADEKGSAYNEFDEVLCIKIQGKTFTDLAMANDRGVSFKSIATWIEKNYKLL